MSNLLCSIYIKSFDHNIIEDSMLKIQNTADRMGILISNPVRLPTQIRKYTVLRGPHVDKKSREQFEVRTHKRVLNVVNTHPRLVEEFLKRIESHLFLSISMKVTRHYNSSL